MSGLSNNNLKPGVNGTLINSFFICKRQTWLVSRNLSLALENQNLLLGRFIDKTSYAREKKRFRLGNIVMDITRLDKGRVVVGEIKKSSKASMAAKMQLYFYLYVLKEYGVDAEGELIFPKERKRERVVLDETMVKELKRIIRKVERVIEQKKPTPPVRVRYCDSCSYQEFCWG